MRGGITNNQEITIESDSQLYVSSSVYPYFYIYNRDGDNFNLKSNLNESVSGKVNSLDWSDNSKYLYLGLDTPPYIHGMTRSGDDFSKISDPDYIPGESFSSITCSSTGEFIFATSSNSSQFYAYQNISDNLIKLNNPSFIPSALMNSASMTKDGNYLAVGCAGGANSDGIYMYKRDGSTWNNISCPSIGGNISVTAVKWSDEDKYLAIGLNTATRPYYYIYKRDGDNFEAVDPSSYRDIYINSTTANISDFAWTSDSSILVASNRGATYPSVHILSFDGSALTRDMSINNVPPNVESCSWTSDNEYLSIAVSAGTPTFTYRKIGANLELQENIEEVISLTSGCSCRYSQDGKYFALGTSSYPYLNITKKVDQYEYPYIGYDQFSEFPTYSCNYVDYVSTIEGEYLLVASTSYPHLFIYKKNVISKVWEYQKNILNPIPSPTVNNARWSADGQYIFISSSIGVTIYKKNGDVFNLLDSSNTKGFPTANTVAYTKYFDDKRILICGYGAAFKKEENTDKFLQINLCKNDYWYKWFDSNTLRNTLGHNAQNSSEMEQFFDEAEVSLGYQGYLTSTLSIGNPLTATTVRNYITSLSSIYELPTYPVSWQTNGSFYIPQRDYYNFALDCSPNGQIIIDGSILLEAYDVSTTNTWDREASIYLEPGYHYLSARMQSDTSTCGIGVAWKLSSAASYALMTYTNFLSTDQRDEKFYQAPTVYNRAMYSFEMDSSENIYASSSVTPYFLYHTKKGDEYPIKYSGFYNLPSSGNSTVISPTGNYIAYAHNNTPYVSVYKKEGLLYNNLLDVQGLPGGNCYDVDWSADENYLAVAGSEYPYLYIYKRDGDLFNLLDSPTDVSLSSLAKAVSWTYDSSYLSVGFSSSPYIHTYRRDGDSFTKLSNPAQLPDGSVNCIDWTNTSNSYMFAGVDKTTVGFIGYEFNPGTETFSKLSFPVQSGIGQGLQFSASDNYIGFALSATPYFSLFKNNFDDTFTRLYAFGKSTSTYSLGTNTGWDVTFSDDERKFLCVQTYSTVSTAFLYQTSLILYRIDSSSLLPLTSKTTPARYLATSDVLTSCHWKGDTISICRLSTLYNLILKNDYYNTLSYYNPDTYSTSIDLNPSDESLIALTTTYPRVIKKDASENFIHYDLPDYRLSYTAPAYTEWKDSETLIVSNQYIQAYKFSNNKLTYLSDYFAQSYASTPGKFSFTNDNNLIYSSTKWPYLYEMEPVNSKSKYKLKDFDHSKFAQSLVKETQFVEVGSTKYFFIVYDWQPKFAVYKYENGEFENLEIPLSNTMESVGSIGISFDSSANYGIGLIRNAPYIYAWKRTGDTFTQIPLNGTQPSTSLVGYSCTISKDGVYAAFGISNIIYIYKRTGDVFNYLTSITSANYVTSLDFSENSDYLAVSPSQSSNFIFKRSGDVFTDITVTSVDRRVAYPYSNRWSKDPSSSFLAVTGSFASSFHYDKLLLYNNKNDDVFTSSAYLQDSQVSQVIASSVVNSLCWDGSSRFSTSISNVPYLATYDKDSSDNFILQSPLSYIRPSSVYNTQFTPDSSYLMSFNSSNPQQQMYEINDTESNYVSYVPKNSGFNSGYELDKNYPVLISFSSSGKYLATFNNSGDGILIYKKINGKLIPLENNIDIQPFNIISASWSPDEKYLCCTSYNYKNWVSIYRVDHDTDNFYLLDVDLSSIRIYLFYKIFWSSDSQTILLLSSTSPGVFALRKEGEIFKKDATFPITLSGSGYAGAYSPDGKYLALTSSAWPYYYFYYIDGDEYIPLDIPLSYPYFSSWITEWSPDSKYLVIMNTSGINTSVQIYKISSSGITEMKPDIFPASVTDPTTISASWSPDSKYLILCSGSRYYLYRVENDNFLAIRSANNDMDMIGPRNIVWSPDNDMVVYTSTVFPYLYSVPIKEVVYDQKNIYKGFNNTVVGSYFAAPRVGTGNLAISPDNKYLATGYQGNFYTNKDSKFQIQNIISQNIVGTYDVTWNSKSDMVAYGFTNSNVYLCIKDKDFFVFRILIKLTGNSYFYSMDFSPDDNYLAIGGNATTVASFGIYYIEKNTGLTSQCFRVDTNPLSPTNCVKFSPNGQYIFIGLLNSPYSAMYKVGNSLRANKEFTLLSNLSPAPTGSVNWASWDSTSTYLAIGMSASPYLRIYKRTGDSLNLLDSAIDVNPNGIVRRLEYSNNGQYLGVVSDVLPRIITYKISGENYTRLEDNFSSDLPGIGYGISWRY